MTVEEEDVELGLPDGPLESYEEHDPFVTKIGGKPTWLCRFPETEKGLVCGVCGSQLYLLLQMDCPPSQRSARIDRIFYLFACNTRTCTESGNHTAVRVIVQCKETTPQQPLQTEKPKGLWDSIMVDDVTKGIKQASLEDTPDSTESCYAEDYPVAFPPVALHIVDELIATHKRPMKVDDQVMEESTVEGESWQGEMYEKMNIVGYDKVFKNFHNRVSHYPRQCVRYCPGGTPLPFCSDPLPVIPPCSLCKRERQFELQVMPAVLSKLPAGEDKYLQHISKSQRGKHPLYSDGMEWGTIMVFSCGICDASLAQNGVFQYESFPVIQTEKDS